MSESKGQNGKGSRRRPISDSQKIRFDRSWTRIFGKKKGTK